MQKSLRILIADDEQDFVHLMKARLESEGHSVTAAHEGVRAIEMVRKEMPDLLLLDLKMPAGSGQSVLQTLRANPETKKLPVIVLTAMAGRSIEEESYRLGADAFIRKPFDIKRLLEKIDSIL